MRLVMLFVISSALAIAFGFLNSGLGEKIKNLKKRKIFYIITTILIISPLYSKPFKSELGSLKDH